MYDVLNLIFKFLIKQVIHDYTISSGVCIVDIFLCTIFIA